MDYRSILFGFVLGILFVISLLALLVHITNKRFIKMSIESFTVDNEDISKLVTNKRKKILKSTRLGVINNFYLVQELTLELVKEIAEYYYPDSKYPHLEITIEEALDMNERILERLRLILDFKLVSFLRNIRISQIISVLEFKKTIEQNKIYQGAKKLHLDKLISYGYAAFNITNPKYWLTRIILTSTLESTLRGVAIMTLNIIGEEANRLYSRKIIDNSDKILEKELEKFIKEIEAS